MLISFGVPGWQSWLSIQGFGLRCWSQGCEIKPPVVLHAHPGACFPGFWLLPPPVPHPRPTRAPACLHVKKANLFWRHFHRHTQEECLIRYLGILWLIYEINHYGVTVIWKEHLMGTLEDEAYQNQLKNNVYFCATLENFLANPNRKFILWAAISWSSVTW